MARKKKKKSKLKRNVIIISIAVIVLVALGITLFFVLDYNKKLMPDDFINPVIPCDRETNVCKNLKGSITWGYEDAYCSDFDNICKTREDCLAGGEFIFYDGVCFEGV